MSINNPTFPTRTFTTTTTGTAVSLRGFFNLYLWGAVATVTLQKSFDEGTTWVAASSDAIGTPAVFTTSVAGYSVVVFEPEAHTQYRLNCTAVTGTLSYRFSQ